MPLGEISAGPDVVIDTGGGCQHSDGAATFQGIKATTAAASVGTRIVSHLSK